MEENMNNEIKPNKNKIILIIVLSILILGLVGYVVYDKVIAKKEVVDNKSSEKTSSSDELSSSEKPSSSEQFSSTEDEKVMTEELWEKLTGFWNRTGETGTEHFFVEFFNGEKDKFLMFGYWYSEGDEVGKIVNIAKTAENKYELKIYYAGGENPFGDDYVERTVSFYVDMTNFANKQFKLSSTEDYQDSIIFEYGGATAEDAMPPMEPSY